MRKYIEQKEYALLYDACMHVRLISDFETINKKIDFMIEISSEDFLPLNQKLRIYQKGINQLTAKDSVDKKIVDSGAYNSISELTKDMQFHDIIHQRLDHIRKINRSIIDELNELSYDLSDLKNTNYIKIIPQLSKVNFVQIQSVNYEYRLVIENLKKTLGNINQLLNVELSLSDVYCFSNVSLFSVLAETICNKLKNISELVYPDKSYPKQVSPQELDYVQEVYTMKTERDIFNRVIELSNHDIKIQTISTAIIKELKESVNDTRIELF